MSDREDDDPAARGALGSRARRTANRDDDSHRPWCKSDFPSDDAAFERCDATLTSHPAAWSRDLPGTPRRNQGSHCVARTSAVQRSTKSAPIQVMVCLTPGSKAGRPTSNGEQLALADTTADHDSS